MKKSTKGEQQSCDTFKAEKKHFELNKLKPMNFIEMSSGKDSFKLM